MSVGAGDRPGQVMALQGRDGRVQLQATEEAIGAEAIALLDKELRLTVMPDLGVRVRIYAADGRTPLIDVATTPQRALNIAALFQRAALRAGATLAPVAVGEVVK